MAPEISFLKFLRLVLPSMHSAVTWETVSSLPFHFDLPFLLENLCHATYDHEAVPSQSSNDRTLSLIFVLAKVSDIIFNRMIWRHLDLFKF